MVDSRYMKIKTGSKIDPDSVRHGSKDNTWVIGTVTKEHDPDYKDDEVLQRFRFLASLDFTMVGMCLGCELNDGCQESVF